MLATTDFPSGDHTKSSLPPNGLDGASPARPALIAVAVLPAAAPVAGSGATNRVLRRPSAQVSQWRTNMLSNTTPLLLDFSRSFSRVAVHARSEPQSWNAPALNSTRSSCGETR